ncbi:hypothetical protein UFOVP1454_24 [uncultured Caudovirales phage]|uniref:Uncharacterized protein n=1 Tax=uncultured Caudovirales phage TaxID=2100421 RepID=A0A6J5SHV7_9CAUD|nr:hypothetical protein UFOVP1454_24 [uncultured Caudovirales phage]
MRDNNYHLPGIKQIKSHTLPTYIASLFVGFTIGISTGYLIWSSYAPIN